ncbi:MAG: isoprenylcysteine carboxylmethyltransferase family protein [Candidatus Aminicenantes bacterium]|nr:isoprenylcysteine carboxylmethyltransferase family protein [Candidatus Aminicenantes bacterium]
MPENPFLKALYRWRVRTAFFAFLFVLVLAEPTVVSIGVGILISLAGLAVRTWASGHLRKDKSLAVSGPYRYTRNPLYLGNFILGISLSVGSHSLWVGAVFAVYFLMFYPAIVHVERERMKTLFPGEYDAYRRFVPLFFPFRRPLRGRGAPFSWKLYARNREYRALIGTAVFWAVMAVKLLLHLPSPF